MQNKNWQKRKKRQVKREKADDKRKQIKKFKKLQTKKKSHALKAPKMTTIKGKRKQKK